jgi:hypothetical protein
MVTVTVAKKGLHHRPLRVQEPTHHFLSLPVRF